MICNFKLINRNSEPRQHPAFFNVGIRIRSIDGGADLLSPRSEAACGDPPLPNSSEVVFHSHFANPDLERNSPTAITTPSRSTFRQTGPAASDSVCSNHFIQPNVRSGPRRASDLTRTDKYETRNVDQCGSIRRSPHCNC